MSHEDFCQVKVHGAWEAIDIADALKDHVGQVERATGMSLIVLKMSACAVAVGLVSADAAMTFRTPHHTRNVVAS